ncbi:carotenoid oxygenase family protein [Erythrobacter sp. Alg231-14]|uniref:carotenoid oxygenase family protein n=1 Tax=Erythrobacter sp. Alg231-14 TaxID=1922225 RepID=UPI00307C848D
MTIEHPDAPFWMTGNFAPVGESIETTDLKITGEIPRELNGRYLRNGPNPRAKASVDWFLGEGMIHGVKISDGKANWYRNRYVQTPLLDFEEITNENRLVRGNSLANTHIVGHADKVLALQETQIPIEMSGDLDTVGPYDFGGKLTGNMTAHPKICPKTGEMLFFGYGIMPPFLTYYRVSPHGELVQSEVIDVKAATMVHDFAITENYVLFMDLPMLWDLTKLGKPGIPISYDESYGARLGVMPRTGTSKDVQWFEIEPCYVYHTMNAYERGSKVIFHAPRMIGYTSVGMKNPPVPKLHRWTIDLDNGSVTEAPLDDLGVDFPMTSPLLVGQPHQHGYAAEFDTGGAPNLLGFHKYDMETGASTCHRLKDGRTGSEAIFIPANDPKSEDDGYLMTYVYDPSEKLSELVILNAKEMSDNPIARIHLQARVPAGFHGSWIAD